MNPQPEPMTGAVLAFALIIFISVSFMVGWVNYKQYVPKKKSDWDLFKLGEIYDEDNQYYTASPTNLMRAANRVPKPKPAVQPKPKPKPKKRKPAKPAKPAKPKPHPLLEDGIAAMVGLGHRKTESKKAVEDVLAKFNPSTIEDVIKLVYQKK